MKTYCIIAHDTEGNEVDRRAGVADVHLTATCDLLSLDGQRPLTISEVNDKGLTRYLVIMGKSQHTFATPSQPKPAKATVAPLTAPVKANPAYTTGAVDLEGKARIDAQQKAMVDAGFKGVGFREDGGTGDQFFTNGTVMMGSGQTVLASKKREHDQLLPFEQAAEQLSATILAESREDVDMTSSQFAHKLEVRGNKIVMAGFTVKESAIRGLLATRLKSPALSYVLGLRDRIRDESYNGDKRDAKAMQDDLVKIAETLYYECMRNPAVAVKCRMRAGVGDIFACTSTEYRAADAPSVIKKILEAHVIPDGTKGSFSYDPDSTHWDLRASTWTPTPTELARVGEPFNAFCTMRSADNGTCSFTTGGGCVIVRCVNCTVYIADMNTSRRRHIGKIMSDIEAMVANGTNAIAVMADAWGVNRETAVEMPSGVPVSVALPGFWSWLMRDRSSELQNVLPGRVKDHAVGLTAAFFDQRKELGRGQEPVSRADFAQAWTSYVQDQPVPVQREAESAIGRWMVKNGKLDHDPILLPSAT